MKKAVFCFLVMFSVLSAIPTLSIITNPDTTDAVAANIKDPISSEVATAIKASTPKKTSAPDKLKKSKSSSIIYKVFNHKTNKVFEVSASDYIKGVVAAEMPASFHPEALKAQAVAANTFAVRVMALNKAATDRSLKGAYFSTDPAKFQAYKSIPELKLVYKNSFDDAYKKISDAVDSVIDKIIVHKNKPIVAAFHSMSGGQTEDAKNVWGTETAYLKSVKSPQDKQVKNYVSSTVLSSDEVVRLLKKQFPRISFGKKKESWFKNISRFGTGSVISVKIGKTTIPGTKLRSVLGLRSTNFTVSYNKSADGFTFTTKGYGHGIGMSQHGANALAQSGKSYKDILTHYYTGISIIDTD